MKKWTQYATAGCLFALAAGNAHAQNATYTFEDPNFSLAETSPLTNRAPASGTPGVLATFTGSPAAGSIQVGDNGDTTPPFTPLFSPSFSGQVLNSVASNQSMVVTLNTLFTTLSVDFYLDSPGFLSLTTPGSGGTSTAGVLDAGTQNYINNLTFSSLTPFNSFTLFTAPASSTAPRPAGFGIDNLSLGQISTVPEPGTVVLLVAGVISGLGLLGRRRVRK